MESSQQIDLLKELPFEDDEELFLSEAFRAGLVLVDIVNGFCSVGAGNLAPTEPNKQISLMIEESVKLAKEFSKSKWPIFAFLDTHYPDKPENPHPPHCIIGSGEENLIPVDGKEVSNIQSKLLCQAILDLYIGEDPFDRRAKEEIMFGFYASLIRLVGIGEQCQVSRSEKIFMMMSNRFSDVILT